MHPILASASKLGMYLLAYLPIGIVLVIGLGHRDAWGTAAAFFLPLTMLYAFIGLSAYYLCLAFPIDSDHPLWRAMPAHMCAAASGGALCVGAAWLWAAVLESLNIGLQPQVFAEHPLVLFVGGSVLYWLAIAVRQVMIASCTSQRSEHRALESD